MIIFFGFFLVYEGISRTKQQIDNTAGALIGEAARQGIYFFILVHFYHTTSLK